MNYLFCPFHNCPKELIILVREKFIPKIFILKFVPTAFISISHFCNIFIPQIYPSKLTTEAMIPLFSTLFQYLHDLTSLPITLYLLILILPILLLGCVLHPKNTGISSIPTREECQTQNKRID
jgi:hypothetical protein